MLQKLLDRWIRPSARIDSEGPARKKMFADIHAGRLWGVDCESVSGPGSGVARASLFRADFERLLQELSIGVMLDAGCGDFNWLPTFDLRGTRVVGVDIVPELISGNRLRHPASRFELADIVVDPLPKTDLILCRDGLVHLSNADIVKALGNFRRSGAKWLLTNTFVDRSENPDIVSGGWRPLNMRLPPFALPAPYRIIDEYCLGYEGAYRDKRLAVVPLGREVRQRVLSATGQRCALRAIAADELLLLTQGRAVPGLDRHVDATGDQEGPAGEPGRRVVVAVFYPHVPCGLGRLRLEVGRAVLEPEQVARRRLRGGRG